MPRASKPKDIYRHSDKAIKHLKRAIPALYQNFSHKLAGWDELNLIRVKEDVDQLFAEMERVVRNEYVKIAREAKKDVDGDPVGINLIWLGLMLSAFSPVTNYQYPAEWRRKRDRTVESLMSSVGNPQLGRTLLRRSMTITLRQITQFCDIITDDARQTAFDQAGVKKVRWVTQQDAKVCSVCRSRSNHIYDLAAVPPKHPNCRCYLVQV